jgi:hypothetical protein
MSDKSYITFLELNKEAANNAMLWVYGNLFDELNKVDISEVETIMDRIKMHHTHITKINKLFDDAIDSVLFGTEQVNDEEANVADTCSFCKKEAVCHYFGGFFFCRRCQFDGVKFIKKSGFPFKKY